MPGNKVLTLLLSAILLVSAACGKDDRNRNNVIDGNNPTTNNTTGTNNGTTSTNNGTLPEGAWGEACIGVECDAGNRCVRGACVDEGLKVICEEPEDLGVVDLGMTYMGTGDTTPYADAITTSCSEEQDLSGAEYAILFQVDQPADVMFSIENTANLDWVIELRDGCDHAGDMENPGIPATCTVSDRVGFFAVPDREYWVILEPVVSIGRGTFNWQLEFTPSQCTVGARACSGATTISQCSQGMDVDLECGTSCTDGVCEGDSCDAPLVVTAPMSWSGDNDAFENNMNFIDQPSCGPNPDTSEGLRTPGRELVLSLPGLTSGQLVTVDASMNDGNDNAIFVLDTCMVEAGCLDYSDSGDILEWMVPAGGDYFIVIDSLDDPPSTFNYSIDIQ